MSGKTAFTPSGLDSLRGGTLSDPLTPGLSIEVLARGKKSWRYERRLIGRDGTRRRKNLDTTLCHSASLSAQNVPRTEKEKIGPISRSRSSTKLTGLSPRTPV